MPKKKTTVELQHFTVDCKAISVDKKARTLKAIMTTGALDRDNEVVDPNGLDFSKFLENPVVLWAHDLHSTPIGKVINITIEDMHPVATVQFADTPKAIEIFELYEKGFLNAWSLGFIPQDRERIQDAATGDYIGTKITHAEVVEFSAVPVPANPQALTKALTDIVTNVQEEAAEGSESDADSDNKGDTQLDTKQNDHKHPKGNVFLPFEAGKPATVAKCIGDKDGYLEYEECDWEISPKAFHKSSAELGEAGGVKVAVKCVGDHETTGVTIDFEVFDTNEKTVTQARLNSVVVRLPESMINKSVHSEESNRDDENGTGDQGNEDVTKEVTVDNHEVVEQESVFQEMEFAAIEEEMQKMFKV